MITKIVPISIDVVHPVACRRSLLALMFAALLCLTVGAGCGGQHRVDAVKKADVSGKGTTLEAAYAGLLTAPVWDQTKIGEESFIRVSGTIRNETRRLEVYYADAPPPAKVLYFTLDGKRGKMEEYPTLISDICLGLQLK